MIPNEVVWLHLWTAVSAAFGKDKNLNWQNELLGLQENEKCYPTFRSVETSNEAFELHVH